MSSLIELDIFVIFHFTYRLINHFGLNLFHVCKLASRADENQESFKVAIYAAYWSRRLTNKLSKREPTTAEQIKESEWKPKKDVASTQESKWTKKKIWHFKEIEYFFSWNGIPLLQSKKLNSTSVNRSDA